MSTAHPAGKKLTTNELVEGLRNRASKVRPDDAGTAHWLDLAADRLAGLDRELTEKAPANRASRRARRKKGEKTPAQLNGYKPKMKPSTLRGGYGTGR